MGDETKHFRARANGLLAVIKHPKFKVHLDQRAIRDRYNLLATKLHKKFRIEEKAPGIEYDMTEGESLIEELIQMEDDSVEQQKINDENTKKKADKGRENANDMCLKAMETLRETKRCKINGKSKKSLREKGLQEVKHFST